MINQIRTILNNVCRVLNKHDVEYLVIGGIAVGIQGYPRYTADIDFWYNPTISNYHRILNALVELNVDISSLSNMVFNPKKTYLRIPDLGVRVEFIPELPGVDSFIEAKRNAMSIQIDGIPVAVLGYEDLLKNKASVGRPHDLTDIQELKKRRE